MWTDALAWTIRFAPWGFAAGGVFILIGGLGIWLYRRDVAPTPLPHKLAAPPVVRFAPPPRHARPDEDTHVIPSIPGAMRPQVVQEVQEVQEQHQAGPVLSPQLRAVARMLDAVDRSADETVVLTPIAGLREERIEAGPGCPTCGGPFGACTCYGQKSAPTSEATQVVDLCPLTTQDIEVRTDETMPIHADIADREPTQELSKTVAKILEATA